MFICDNVEENIFSIGDRRGMKTSNKRKVVLFGILNLGLRVASY